MSELITCGGCNARWTAGGAAHCSSCHRLFSTPTLFDLHRSAYGERGACIDPQTVVARSGARKGERVMLLRDGMFRGPEMTDAEKTARFGSRAS